MVESLRIVSFNCSGVKRNLGFIQMLCMRSDIVLLQETWLMPHELGLFDSIDGDFCSFSQSSVDDSSLLVGRPYGGLSILWRRNLAQSSQIVGYDDDRMLALKLSCSFGEIMIMNVYLPYFSRANYDEYITYLGKLTSVVNEDDLSNIIIMGDFNADPKSSFYRELDEMCKSECMYVCDVESLPMDSFTHVNNNALTKSWLDHCVIPLHFKDIVQSIEIDSDFSCSDHAPLTLKLNPRNFSLFHKNNFDNDSTIAWEFENSFKRNLFFNILNEGISNVDLSCIDDSHICHNVCHKTIIENNWNELIDAISDTGSSVFTQRKYGFRVVPGWNTHVKQLYTASRDAFKLWRDGGSPKEGVLAQFMRSTRAEFKYALRGCHTHENNLRAEALANKLAMNKNVDFWKEIKKLNTDSKLLATCVDGVSGEKDIADLWGNKFSTVMNSLNDDNDRTNLIDKLNNECSVPVEQIDLDELNLAIGKLSTGKSVGLDLVPAEFFKYAPINILKIILKFFNLFLLHCFLPNNFMKTCMVPIIKNKFRSGGDSNNYRPIAISTAASKVFELIILGRIEHFLTVQHNQFGFKKGHSTDKCIYIFKEIVNYYHYLNTPIFACFIDIKSAFDRVNYSKLFELLLEKGVPVYIVKILFYWYSNQSIFVRWGTKLSEPFKMMNGIRQGSILSPHLFNVYVDPLTVDLNMSGVGCFIGDAPFNNISYADDMVLISPSATALNDLIKMCTNFAKDYDIIYSVEKTVCMCICPKNLKLKCPPNIYLDNTVLKYVNEFNYLGHIVDCSMSDEPDIRKETRKLSARGNALVRKFKFASENVKINLFKTFCYTFYCSSLWAK